MVSRLSFAILLGESIVLHSVLILLAVDFSPLLSFPRPFPPTLQTLGAVIANLHALLYQMDPLCTEFSVEAPGWLQSYT